MNRKLSILLLSTCLLTSPAAGFAQKTQPVTLSVQNESVETVFQSIQKQTGLKFFYDAETVGRVPSVTLNANKDDLKSVLNKITRTTQLRFERQDGTILVSLGKSSKADDGKKIKARGKVVDQNGEPIIGANIKIQGTSTGTITDMDGNFNLSAVTGQTLLVSYIGYESSKVRVADKFMKIELSESAIAVDEVVVTALGIKKEKKALAYSVTEVKGNDMNRVKVANLANSLSGKVAGVNVSRPSSGMMGSSRIVIRGNGSLRGSNQPLYVIDGVPMDNTTHGQPGMWGGTDGGDGISSINSEDIESMSVLKGGTAAALYGSRAANGAIVITTKKGSIGKVRVEYGLSYTNEHLRFKNDDLQWEYGAGAKGANPDMMAYGQAMQMVNGDTTIPDEMKPALIQKYAEMFAPMMAGQLGMMSFGGKLDGKDVMQFDGVRRPYAANGRDNFKNFYQDGWAVTNNLAVSGGSDKVQFRLAVGDQRFHDLMPNAKMERDNITLNVNSKLDEHLNIKANVMYMRERTHNRPNYGDLNFNANATLYMLPPNIDVRTLEKRMDEHGNEFLPTAQPFIANPYYAAYENSTEDGKDRVIGSIEAQYNFTPNWYLRGRVGGDINNRRSESIIPKGCANNSEGGTVSHNSVFYGEFNAEAIAGYTNSFKDGLFSVDAFLGWNTMGTWSENTSSRGTGFIDPGFNKIGSASITSGGFGRSESYINSLFGQAEFSYNNMLYLTLTGRNDWFSALSYMGKTTPNHIFYPSVGAGFIVSEAMDLPDWIPFLKVRGSWAESGGGVDPYSLGLVYNYNQSMGQYPIGFIGTNTIPNLNLKPLTSISYEAGLEARFLNNRIGIDFTYYVRNTKNDIVDAGVSHASGYNNVRINAGKVHNHGIEFMLNTVPVKTKHFTWNSTLNFSYNKSEVKRITDNIDSFILETARTGHDGDNGAPAYIYHQVGEPYGIIKGVSFKRNEQGEIMYQNGLPMRGEVKKLGESVAPYALGFTNSFSYRGFNLSFLIDAKIGGELFSMTNDHMYCFGRHADTLEGREGGVIGKGVKEDGKTPNDVKVDAMTYYMALGGITEQFVYDASYVKLRELSVGYTFPQKLVKKMGLADLSLALVGRNLWNIYDDVPLVDPESSLSNGNGQGFENYGMPATRSIGFNLNVKF